MSTYQELKMQAADLLAQAEKLRQQEKRSVVSALRQQIQEYGVTASELGFASGGAASGGRRSTAIVKFRSPNGVTWSGRGRKPRWLADALAAGRSLEEFRA